MTIEHTLPQRLNGRSAASVPQSRDWLFVRGNAMSDRARIITEIVAAEYNVTVADLKGPRRSVKLAWPRFAAISLILEYCPEFTLPMVGQMFNRDHTTVMNARKRACQYLQDPNKAVWRTKFHNARAKVEAL